MQRIVSLPFAEWSPDVGTEGSRHMTEDLEAGRVLFLPGLEFSPKEREYRFFDPSWLGRRQKLIAFDPARGEGRSALSGAKGTAADLHELAAMIARFRVGALTLVAALFPTYKPWLRAADTTFRPMDVEEDKRPWREDDSLLHVDAFPARPCRGGRILRVFSNVNPAGVPRLWKLGGNFESIARQFAPVVDAPLPGAAALLRLLRLTHERRSLYDHLMLGMHDAMKQDADYQARASHQVFPFPDGSTWICFPDQCPHAALAGQFLLEQTVLLPVTALEHPEHAPLRVLERLLGQTLV